VLSKPHAWNLVVSIDKCKFHKDIVEFLGYIIFRDDISISEEKIEAIRSWESPKTQKDVQTFMGFANFYRRFIENFSKIVKPLTDLTKEEVKGKNFQWSTRAEAAFNQLKINFTMAPILRNFDPKLSAVIEIDASDFAIDAILSQVEDGHLKPVA
jgi:hypothetical protein